MKKTNKHIRAFVAAVLLTGSLNITGCGLGIQIFEDPEAKYRMKPYSDYELKSDVFYVKNGTKFYEMYPDNSKNGSDSSIDTSKCTYVYGDYMNKVPTYYRDELIAYASEKNAIDDVTALRYRDTGYSIGVFGAVFEDGYIKFRVDRQTAEGSDASQEFANNRSDEIMIETINGKKVSADMLNRAGVLAGFEKDKTYDVTFYAGTYYGEASILADTHFFQQYELYSLDDHSVTKNGYIAIRMPEDAKSGYYMVDGGLFRYLSSERGKEDLDEADYNLPYYLTEEDQLAAYSQQFTFENEAEADTASVVAEFEPESVADGSERYVKMMVTSPDGTRLTTKPDEEGKMVISYTKMMPGRWTVNIVPQTLSVIDVSVKDNAITQEKTENSYTFSIDEEKTGLEFYIVYMGEGEVNAYVTGPDGHSHDLYENKKEGSNGDLGYTYSYVAPGTYTIKVYHDPDTKITEADYDYNESYKSEDIITVEE